MRNIPGWQTQAADTARVSPNGGGFSSSSPINTGFSSAMIRNIQPLLSPGTQDNLANQQWQVARDNAMQQIGDSNQHLAEQWAARSGRSLSGGGGIGVQAELNKTRLDPALAAIEQNRIGQMMQQRNMLSSFAPALLAMQQRQAEFDYQRSQDKLAQRRADQGPGITPGQHTGGETYGLFGTGQGSTAPMQGGGGFAGDGGGGFSDPNFGKLGSQRDKPLWAAPKKPSEMQTWTSGTPSAIKGNAFNAASQGLSGAAAAIRRGLS